MLIVHILLQRVPFSPVINVVENVLFLFYFCIKIKYHLIFARNLGVRLDSDLFSVLFKVVVIIIFLSNI